jgi:hypothetical protein
MTKDRTTDETDVITKLSQESVPDTVAKLTGMIGAKGMKLFGVFDQAAEAREVGLELRETTLVIFGSPKAGTAAQGADLGRRRPDEGLLLQPSSPGFQPSPDRQSGREHFRSQRPDRRPGGRLAPGGSLWRRSALSRRWQPQCRRSR